MPIKVRVGQTDAVKILSSAGGGSVESFISKNVIGGIASVTQLDVTGISTFNGNINVTGVSTFNDVIKFNNADVIFQGAAAGQNITFDASENDLEFTDNARIKFGDNDDLEIWHDGTNSNVKNSTGDFHIRSDSLALKTADNSERYLKATKNQDIKLYYNGNEKFATLSTGATVTGDLYATTFYGDGSKLSNIPSLTGVSTGVGTFIASAGVSTNIDSFAYASLDYKLAEYSLHFMNGSNIQAERIIVMQDNTTAYSNEFAIMSSSDLLISVGATISGSNLLIQATPETGVSGLTTYRWRREVQE